MTEKYLSASEAKASLQLHLAERDRRDRMGSNYVRSANFYGLDLDKEIERLARIAASGAPVRAYDKP